jgi:ribosomal protein S2
MHGSSEQLVISRHLIF